MHDSLHGCELPSLYVVHVNLHMLFACEFANFVS